MLPEAVCYTDGSSGKNGEGGYAALLATEHYGIEITGYVPNTTNNRMELMAAIKGLSFLHAPHEVKLVSDSAYMLNTIKYKWYERWFEEKIPRKNMDLWSDIRDLLCYHIVEPIKVKGHTGVEHNERVDKLAVAARKNQTESFEVLYGSIT